MAIVAIFILAQNSGITLNYVLSNQFAESSSHIFGNSGTQMISAMYTAMWIIPLFLLFVAHDFVVKPMKKHV
ncbi:hypothetical protein HOF65_05130 [bacterium]|nr:hypothetical protein [bacterium]MBT3853337.1 hypothetical protein [bacterium]MBT6778839.1 hypothetical protein [bacterium]